MDKRDTDSPRSATINAVVAPGSRPADQAAQTQELRETVQASDDNQVDGAPVKRGRGRPKGRKTSKEVQRSKVQAKILEYRALGLPVGDIANAVEMSETRVKEILSTFEPVFRRLKDLDKYRSVRNDLLTATELTLLESVNDQDKIDGANLQQVAYAFEKVHTARRLDAGLATQNTAVATIQVRSDRPKFSHDN